jgi:hypothetical protein
MSPRGPVRVAAVLAVAATVAGCNTSALSKRELVVHFDGSATTAQHRAALDACAHVSPETSPEPFSTSGPVSNQVGDVRFRIDHANDKAIATLETCLYHQPGVDGVNQPDLTE